MLNSGGVKIPEWKKREVQQRIEQYANDHFAGKFSRLGIRFRSQFCYIDAYQEPVTTEEWPPEDWPETREAFIERLRNTPVKLCRLRYFGGDDWGFGFFAYSSEKYKPSFYPNGSLLGTPEEAFATAGSVYL